MSERLIAEFAVYLADICDLGDSPPKEWSDKIRAILGRLVDAAVRQASSSLLPADLDLATLTDAELELGRDA